MTVVRTTLSQEARERASMIRRCTVPEFNDKKKLMQELKKCDTFHGYSNADVEYYHPVGLTGTALKQDQGQQQQNQQGQSGGGQDENLSNDQQKGKSAEGIVLYVNSDHPVCVVCDDRRVRPYDMPEGCNAHYSIDGNGGMIYHHTKKGSFLVTTNNPPYDNSGGQSGGGSQSLGASQQQQAKRKVSMRHATKDQQTRNLPNNTLGGDSQGGGGQQQQQDQQEYPHHGKHVNTEMSNDENLHQVNVDYDDEGDNPKKKIVGQYNVSGKQWDWDVNGEGKTTRTMNMQQIKDSSDNHYVNANQVLSQQSGQSSSYSAGSSLFVGGQTTHLHGQIIAEPINLGHFNKTALASAFHREATAEHHMLLGTSVSDSGMTMTTSVSQGSPPSIPELGVPYDGFRWIDTTSGIEYSYYQGTWAEGGGNIGFPGSPAYGQTFVYQNRQWQWNGIGWQSTLTAVNPEFHIDAGQTPGGNGGIKFELTNNTTLTIKVKGTDGVVRSAAITLS